MVVEVVVLIWEGMMEAMVPMMEVLMEVMEVEEGMVVAEEGIELLLVCVFKNTLTHDINGHICKKKIYPAHSIKETVAKGPNLNKH